MGQKRNMRYCKWCGRYHWKRSSAKDCYRKHKPKENAWKPEEVK